MLGLGISLWSCISRGWGRFREIGLRLKEMLECLLWVEYVGRYVEKYFLGYSSCAMELYDLERNFPVLFLYKQKSGMIAFYL